MPAVLRICTGATCPRKKTCSGKSLPLMSAAFRVVSGPAGGAANTGACTVTRAASIPRVRTFVQVMMGYFLRRLVRSTHIVACAGGNGSDLRAESSGSSGRQMPDAPGEFPACAWRAVLFELLAETGELLLEVGDFAAHLGHLAFQAGETFVLFGVCGSGFNRSSGRFPLGLLAAEQVGVAGLFRSGLARQDFDQRLFAGHQLLQRRLHVGQVFEAVHALGASAELARGLRAA